MRTVLVLTALVAVGLAIPHPVTIDQEWNEYKKEFGKFYTSQSEDIQRLNAYLKTKQRVEEHNRKYERGETSYTKKMNKFADWFPEELARLNGIKLDEDRLPVDRKVLELPEGVEAPEEINWVEKGAVTSVKDQGHCGSCYAFSAVGALEGLMFAKNKTITDLSVQELIDCSSDLGNNGCDGGSTFTCFFYVAIEKQITTNSSYPYEAKEIKCRLQNKRFGASCDGFVLLTDSEGALKNAVGTIGPISIYYGVSIDFIDYSSGIYDGSCADEINHAMLVVGYGKDKESKKDYWLVKNSWGASWGLSGYVKIERGVNKCNISQVITYPIEYKKRE